MSSEHSSETCPACDAGVCSNHGGIQRWMLREEQQRMSVSGPPLSRVGEEIEVMPVAEHEAEMESARNLRVADEQAAQWLSNRISGLREAALVALKALERGSHPRDDARVKKALEDSLAEHGGLDLR